MLFLSTVIAVNLNAYFVTLVAKDIMLLTDLPVILLILLEKFCIQDDGIKAICSGKV